MTEPLYDDPVVAEIHAIREKMLADCGGDLRLLMQRVRQRQRASGRRVRPLPEASPAVTRDADARSSLDSPFDEQTPAE